MTYSCITSWRLNKGSLTADEQPPYKTECHANVRLRLRRSNSMFLQPQFEALSTFSMPSGRLFQLEIVAGKIETYMIHNLPRGV